MSLYIIEREAIIDIFRNNIQQMIQLLKIKLNNIYQISTVYTIEFFDYIIEQSSGKVLRGTSDRKMRVKYEMKFRQTLDESKKSQNVQTVVQM